MTDKCQTCSRFVAANGKCKNCKGVPEQKSNNSSKLTPKHALLNFNRSLSGDSKLSPSADQTNALEQLIRRVVKEEMDRLFDSLKKATDSVEILQDENKMLKGRCERLAADMEELRAEFREEVDEINQYSRRNNLLISGVPESPQENLDQLFTKLAGRLDSSFDPRDIDVIHRLPQSMASNKPSPIVVRLARRSKKNFLLTVAKKKNNWFNSSHLGLPGQSPIFVNEHLTPKRAALLRKARQVKIKLKFKFLWTREGKIFLRKDEESMLLPIRSIADLHALDPGPGTESGTHDGNQHLQSPSLTE